MVLRTRISVEQARILSHSATTRGKGRRAIPPWQTRRGNTCGVSVSASLKTKYAFIEQYLFHGNVGITMPEYVELPLNYGESCNLFGVLVNFQRVN